MRFTPHPEPPRSSESVATTQKARVLFVCYGNACRSQMAEGFARAFHADVMNAESAGISPLGIVPPETSTAMLERDVSLKSHHSKGMDAFDLRSFDLIVNMSGFPFPNSVHRAVTVLEWTVEDPYQGNERRYRKVRDEIERRVAKLADSLRESDTP